MHYDVIILGAGAAGLMCAIEAGKRGRKVLVVERNRSVGEKIRISGGGRCNFTNINASPENYLSSNPHFVKSALSQYTAQDFIALVEKHGISYHEKKLGQLFCDRSAQQIIDMMMKECRAAGVVIDVGCGVNHVQKDGCFQLNTGRGDLTSDSLVVATGGLSIPKLGATDLGYAIAKQFNLEIISPRAGLVPLTLKEPPFFKLLSGISIDVEVSCHRQQFRENLLFTHRGLSGPAILQISSYWKEGDPLFINLLPEIDISNELSEHRQSTVQLKSFLAHYLPARFVDQWCEPYSPSRPLLHFKQRELDAIADRLQRWELRPDGTEGFAKAEVTCGGIDTDELSSKTLEARKVPGLYFIGEVVDVTGWLGGYNFQWAWSSGWVAGQYA